MLVINVLYSAKSDVLSVFFPYFIPEYDAVLHARIIAKWIVPFLLLPDFGRFTRPHTPHFSALYTQNSTSAPLFRCPEPSFLIPQTTIWDVPFCHLGCPILPFGVYFRHICAQCTARFSVCHLRFSLQNICVFFVNWEN